MESRVSSEKSQHPSSKIQRSIKIQAPNVYKRLLLNWSLKLGSSLDLGSWILDLCNHVIFQPCNYDAGAPSRRNSIVSNPFCFAAVTMTSTFVAADSNSNCNCASLRVKKLNGISAMIAM